MPRPDTCVVVGAGHAGGRAVQILRTEGFDGKVILIGDEPHLPYVRPPLSKEMLTGDQSLERAYVNAPQFYAAQAVDVRLSTSVVAIDCHSQRVTCSDGAAVRYDRLLLTTGATVRTLNVPGAGLPGVHHLRTYEDSLAIRRAIASKGRVAIVGGGFIGLEVAASARTEGCAVHVIEATHNLLTRAVAPEVGRFFHRLHSQHGVVIHLDSKVAAIEGTEKVESVLLADGRRLAADFVVVGIGIEPNIALAQSAGIAVLDGIVVDEYGRTSAENVFAAGDVCSQPNDFIGRRVRLESYQNAQEQATRVASNMCRPPADMHRYCDRLWFWTTQYKTNLQMVGRPFSHDHLIFRGDVDGDSFTVFYMENDRIVAVNAVNNGREIQTCERLMQTRRAFSCQQLSDPTIKLRSLL